MEYATLRSRIFRQSPGGGSKAEEIHEVHVLSKCPNEQRVAKEVTGVSGK